MITGPGARRPMNPTPDCTPDVGPSVLRRRAVSRRRFLRGAGIAMALPLLDAMVPALARAASGGTPAGGAAPGATPRRMFAICNNLGLLPDQFFPKGGGRDYAPSPYLEELKGHRDDFTVF